MRPINRLPPEILLHIFSLAPKKTPFLRGRGSKPLWPFNVPDMRDLRHLSQVCTHWREVALVAPALWSAYREGGVYRSSPRLNSLYIARCPTGPIDIYVDNSFSNNLRELLLDRGHQVRQLHVQIGGGLNSHDEDARQLVATLSHMNAELLEHCCLQLLRDASAHLQQIPSLCRHGNATRLRSLSLSVYSALPQWELPSLVRCLLSKFDQYGGLSNMALDPSSLLRFLSGTPRLEILHLYWIMVLPFQQTPPPPQPISLTRLRYLSYMPPSNTPCTDFLLHIHKPSRCQVDIGGIVAHEIWHGDAVQSVIRTWHGAALPMKIMGIEVEIQGPGILLFTLELARGASPEWSGCTRIRLNSRSFSNATGFWRPLLTPELCAELEEVRVDVSGECEYAAETAAELAAMWPLFVKIRKLSVAFRWDRSDKYLDVVRRVLEPLAPPTDALAMHPSLDTLNLMYIEAGNWDVAQYLTDFLSARTSRGGRVRRLVLGAPKYEYPPFDVSRLKTYVDEFVWLEYKVDLKEWPVPIDRKNESELVGADWPVWISMKS